MNKSAVIVIAVIIVVAGVIGAFALSGSDNDNNIDNIAPDTSQQDTTTLQETSTPENAAEKIEQAENADVTADIVMSNFEFSQGTIEANPGDVVRVDLSVDSGSHDFVIDELGVQSEVIGSGSTDTVTFTIPDDASGTTFAFYCSIGNHREMGMEGELVIN